MIIPISLYIHTPWCVRKCPYCDFNSHPQRGDIPEQAYLEALIEDLNTKLAELQHRPLHSIFIGGGTPSLMSGDFYQQLLAHIQSHCELNPGIEVTMEANPGTMEQQRFDAYRLAGINRLSIGIQSFNEQQLKQLGRIHSATEASNALSIARQAGFDNVNIDIMHGLSNQSLDEALDDLHQAIELQPQHLSWYQLTLEPNTLFHKYPPPLPNDDAIIDMQIAGKQLLQKHNYQQYEVSAYSLPNKQCQHNLNYWQFGDYIAIGAGAHGKVTDLATQKITRYWNFKHPRAYLNREQHYVGNRLVIPKQELALEYFMNTMRLQTPIDLHHFAAFTGLKVDDIQKPLTQAIESELITLNKRTLTLTDKGHRYLNELLGLFL